MIEDIGIGELEHRIHIDHPAWVDAGVHHEACHIISTFDHSLATALTTYVREGRCIDAQGDGIGTQEIRTFAGCDYIEALEIVNLSFTSKRRAIYAAVHRRHLTWQRTIGYSFLGS